MMTNQPSLFWGIIVSMWIGNLLLLVLNLPLVRLWVRMIAVPYHFLFPAICIFCAIGAYSVNASTFDIRLLVLFGCVGYLLQKLNCELAPLLLGFVLGPMMEEYLRRALLVAHGDATVFVTRPISLALLALAAALLASVLLLAQRRTREVAFESQD